ncbi:hypothetical protein V8E52_008128 [Russula decolorans]
MSSAQSAESPQRPLLSAHTDDKVDHKVEPVPSDQLPPSYQAASEAPPPPPTDAAEPDQSRCCRHRRRCRRFAHFFIALLFLWFTARYIVRHCQLRRFAHPHTDDFPWGHPPGHPGHGGHRPRPGEHIDSCVDSTDWIEVEPIDGHYPPGFEAWQRAELSLPSSADDIFLFSPGFHTGGVLHLVEAPDRDDIGVEVTVGSRKDSGLFQRTNLCTLRRGKDGHGVGIFTHPFKRHSQDRDSLFFNITVSLPEGKDVTTIPHFETRLPKYTHVITALKKHAFGFISLHSFDSPIFVESLVGNKINIRSRNGPIVGTFNTSSALEVKTSNSPIRVTVNAFNADSHIPTKVKLHTRNSILSAELALLSTPESQSNGSFFVSAYTSNSPLLVNFTEHASDAQLKLHAKTSNSPARVHLQPAFEGTFKLRTSIFPALVSPDADAEDPAGRDRQRVVDVKTLGHGSGVVYGDAEWVPQDEEAPAGRVEVSTSNSPLHLSL